MKIIFLSLKTQTTPISKTIAVPIVAKHQMQLFHKVTTALQWKEPNCSSNVSLSTPQMSCDW